MKLKRKEKQVEEPEERSFQNLLEELKAKIDEAIVEAASDPSRQWSLVTIRKGLRTL